MSKKYEVFQNEIISLTKEFCSIRTDDNRASLYLSAIRNMAIKSIEDGMNQADVIKICSNAVDNILTHLISSWKLELEENIQKLISNELDSNGLSKVIYFQTAGAKSLAKLYGEAYSELISEKVKNRLIKFDEEASILIEQYKKSKKNDEKGCYIATMIYGNYDHPQVLALRMFRDNTLSKSKFGNKLINTYYQHSPRMVEALKDRQATNKLIKVGLDCLIKFIKK